MGVFISKLEIDEERVRSPNESRRSTTQRVKSLSELSNENLTAKILGRKPESLFD